MKNVNQNGAMAFLGLLMVVLYYVFLQQDLISTTEVITSKCLDSSSQSYQLCISCIQRSQLSIANESSIYITDNANEFKVMTIPQQGFFTCEELLQFASYELPMQKTSDIKFEQLGPSKQIIDLLQIQISETAVNKFEAQSQKESVAIFQIKKFSSLDTTLITYSSEDGQVWARYYGQIISECSMILAIFCIFYYRIKEKEIKLSCIGCIFISFMILSETMLSNTNYLINYSIALTIGFFFASSSMARPLTVIAMLLFIAADIFNVETECLIVVFFTYIIFGSKSSSKRVSTFVQCCIAALFVCSAFRQHHHWLSLPFRKIIEYTILCLAPLLMIMIKNAGDQIKYERLSNGKTQENLTTSGVSLPGFEQEEDSEDEQN